MRRRQAQHGAGVDPATEIAADRHVGPEAQAYRLVEGVPEPLGVLGVGAISPVPVDQGVVEVPVADQPDLAAGGEQEVAGRHLVDAVEESAVLGDHQEVVGMEERVAVPAGGNAGREQRLDLGGQVERTAVMRVVERLDAEAIPRREERVVEAVPEGEGELAAQLAQAGRAEVLIEVQSDLAIGAGAEAVASALEVLLYALEVVELAIDDDPQALVLAGDRLLAGGQVDDAESGMAEPDPPIAGDPRPLSIRPAVGEPEGRLLQGGGRDRSPRRVHRRNPAHGEPPFLVRPSSGWASSL